MAEVNPGTDDLIAWWDMEGAGGEDETDLHSAITITETSGTIASAGGVVGNARDFELADTEYFTTIDSAALSTGDIDFLWAFWVKLESKATQQGFVYKWIAGTDEREYAILYIPGPDRFYFVVSGDGTGGQQSTVVANNLGNVALATDYFVVCWHDATANKIYIQVNDGAVDETAHATGVNDSTSPLYVGADLESANYADCVMDEVCFFKAALSADERSWLYNTGSGRTYADLIEDTIISVPLAEVEITGLVPTIVVTDHQMISVPLAEVEITGLVPKIYHDDTHRIKAYLDGVWTNISSDVIGDITGYWGMVESGSLDNLADTGLMTIKLKNPTGQYWKASGATLSGWAKGTIIKLEMHHFAEDYVRGYGKIVDIDPYIGVVADNDYVIVTVADWMDYAATHPMLTPAIQADKRADEMMTTIAADMPIAPQDIDYDTGINTFPLTADAVTKEIKAYSEYSKIARSELGYIYLIKDPVYGETLVFENAYARSGLRTPDITIDNSMTSLDVEYGENVINRFVNTAYPRYTAADLEVLFSLEYPMLIGPAETVTFFAKYSDPSGGGDIAGTNMVAPVITTDYLMNKESGGGGDNISADLTITADYYAAVVKYTLTNDNTAPGYIIHLQARGKGIYQYSPIQAAAEDSDSVDEYDYQQITLDQKYKQDIHLGAAFGKAVVEFERRPRTKLNKVHFVANRSDALMLAWLEGDVGVLVHIQETDTAIDEYAYIQGVEFSISPTELIKFAWILKSMKSLNKGLSLINTEYTAASGDGLNFGYIPAITASSVTSKTFSAWVKTGAAYSGLGSTIIAEYSAYTGILIQLFEGGGGPFVNLSNTRYPPPNPGEWKTPDNSIADNTLQHIFITYDMSNAANDPAIWIDNAPQAITEVLTPAGALRDTEGIPFQIGNCQALGVGGWGAPFIGQIYDVRVWDRILTATEKTTIYGGGDVDSDLVFQAPCVRTTDLSYYEDKTLATTDKMIDNMYGMIGTPNDAIVTRLL